MSQNANMTHLGQNCGASLKTLPCEHLVAHNQRWADVQAVACPCAGWVIKTRGNSDQGVYNSVHFSFWPGS